VIVEAEPRAGPVQLKICTLGAFAVGKTSLVARYVHAVFSERYHTTLGVKIDRKTLALDGTPCTLLLWDIAGEDDFQRVRPTYLRGSAGLLYVVDGTRAETVEVARQLRKLADDTIGQVPAALALNKADLGDLWELDPGIATELTGDGWYVFQTSAKTGDGVEAAFAWLARAARRG
jgi:small GTP-binding protein